MFKTVLIILIFSFHSFAQNPDFDSRVNNGIKQIYNIKFIEAEKTFRSIMTDYPEHPSGRFFLQ